MNNIMNNDQHAKSKPQNFNRTHGQMINCSIDVIYPIAGTPILSVAIPIPRYHLETEVAYN